MQSIELSNSVGNTEEQMLSNVAEDRWKIVDLGMVQILLKAVLKIESKTLLKHCLKSIVQKRV